MAASGTLRLHRRRGPAVGSLAIALAFGLAAPIRAQVVDLQLVALDVPGVVDTAASLPVSETVFLEGTALVVELWAQTTEVNGLSSVSADISFNTALADITALTPSATFNVLTHGVIDNVTGLVNDLSGSHLGPCTDAMGAAPNWVRVAVIDVLAQASGTLTLQTGASGSPIYGTAVCGVGDVLDTQIAFGAVTVSLVQCLADVDCDDGQFCNGIETCDLVTNTCTPGVSPSCDDQIDCTDDSCDPLANGGTGGCVNTPNNGNCTDGIDCTVDACDQLGAPGTGCSYTPNNAACDDLVDCTDDACDQLGAPGTGCSYTPNDAACDDLVACTIDACDQLGAPGTGCSHLAEDAFCDNALFCDGTETCDLLQGCLPGTAPCVDACEHCLESTATCQWCILDLDNSGIMGTGDFSLFSPCFGACYPAGHACLSSNFDGDTGGCVGTSDFAAFVGCFGDACGACAGCAGPGGTLAITAGGGSDSEPSWSSPPAKDDARSSGLAALATAVEFRLTAQPMPSPTDTAGAVPASQSEFGSGETAYLEVWVQTSDPNGLSSASLDLLFDASLVAGVATTSSSIFAVLTHGVVDNGLGVVDDLSGSHLGPCADTVGVAPSWARVAVVEFSSQVDGVALFETAATGSAVYGSALCGLGDVNPADVLHDSLAVTFGTSAAPAAPLPAGGIHAPAKQRYISWTPDPAETSNYGFQVEHPLSGRAYYVSAPQATPPSAVGRGITLLVSDSAPVLYDWSIESVVHASGCMIAPGDQVNTAGGGHEYRVRATADGANFSAPLTVFTAARPTDTRWWADVVGGFSAGEWTPPNGLMNGFDVTATLRTFQNNPASPGTTLERADLNPETADRTVNGQDVLQAVNAFSLQAYPFRVPLAPGDNGQAECPQP